MKQAIGVAHSDRAVAAHLRATLGAFVQEHVDDLPRRAIAEKLAQRLFMPGDAVRLDQGEEIGRGIPAERRAREMRIFRQIAIGRGVQVGEIAASAPEMRIFLPGFSA
jgi:hypothetical protein